jgi:hypothetical protein
MRIEKQLWSVIVAVLCLCLVSPAEANAASIPVDSLRYIGPGLNEVVDIKIGSFTGNVYAGFSNVELTVSSNTIWDGDYSGFGFCTEDQTITPGTYTGYYLYEVEDPLTKAAWLMDRYLTDASTDHGAASLQVAIWESAFDSEFDLESGGFYIRSSTWDRTLSNSYLTALAGADLSGFSAAAYRFVSDDGDGSSGKQDFIVYNSAVPIQNAVWLLGSGLIGLVGIRRRTRT